MVKDKRKKKHHIYLFIKVLFIQWETFNFFLFWEKKNLYAKRLKKSIQCLKNLNFI